MAGAVIMISPGIWAAPTWEVPGAPIMSAGIVASAADIWKKLAKLAKLEP